MADNLLEFENPIYSGSTIYAVFRNTSAQWFTGSAYETYNASDWASYGGTNIIEAGASGYFSAATPALTPGIHDVGFRLKTAGAKAPSDLGVAGFRGEWDGTSWYIDYNTPVNISGAVLASNGLDNVVTEVGLNFRQSQSLIAAALLGILSGGGTNTITIQGAGVSTVRITATVDANGNWTLVVLNPPA